jgi:hypothetical protein
VVVGSSITKQPTSLSVFATQTATFSVTVAGVSPFTYQWYRIPSGSSTGVVISGATSGSYTTPALTTSNSGDKYYATITDSCSTLTSSNATLTVSSGNVPPTITTQPVGGTVAAGATTTFSVVASGTPTLTYQWYRIPTGSVTGTAVAGASSAGYTVPASMTTNSNDQDAYYVMVSNGSGQAVSQHATLAVGNGEYCFRSPVSHHRFRQRWGSRYLLGDGHLRSDVDVSVVRGGSRKLHLYRDRRSYRRDLYHSLYYQHRDGFGLLCGRRQWKYGISDQQFCIPFIGVLANIPSCNSTWNILGSTTAFDSNTCSFQLTAATGTQHGEIVWPTLQHLPSLICRHNPSFHMEYQLGNLLAKSGFELLILNRQIVFGMPPP